jgi:hypothetical protein
MSDAKTASMLLRIQFGFMCELLSQTYSRPGNFSGISTFNVKGHRNHMQAHKWRGMTFAAATRGKDPKSTAIFADKFARDARVVPSLAVKLLRVKELPRSPGPRRLIKFKSGDFPSPLGIVQVDVVPLGRDVEI